MFSSAPNFDLENARRKNNLKLKSAFESLFEKYNQTFEGDADEIDLTTLEVVQNNGFLDSVAFIPFAEFDGISEAEEGELLASEFAAEQEREKRELEEKELIQFCQEEKGFDIFEMQLMQVSKSFKK